MHRLLAVVVIALVAVVGLTSPAQAEEVEDGQGSTFFCYAGDHCTTGRFYAQVWFKYGISRPSGCPVSSHATGRATKLAQGRVKRLAVYWVQVVNPTTNEVLVESETDHNTGNAGESVTSLTPNRDPRTLPEMLLVRVGIGVRWVEGNVFSTRILTSLEPFHNLAVIWGCV
jgi:hypothetical protein